jgi:LysM repeat protein
MLDSINKGMADARIQAVTQAVKNSGIGISGLDVSADGESIVISGTVDTDSDWYAIRDAAKAVDSGVSMNVGVTATGGNGQTYTIASGDTLWAIAQKFYGDGNHYKKIYEANKAIIGSNPDHIQVGQQIVIP